MAYFAYITKLTNVEKDPNSDNLYIAKALGENVIVGCEAYENQRVIYFPADGQIQDYNFCMAFNLLRKDKDGNPAGGYLEPSQHIRALKLRGLRSEGIVISLDKFAAYWKLTSHDFKDGEQIDKIGDTLLVKKYIPPTKQHNSLPHTSLKGKHNRKGVVYPEFAMHIDTAQYAYCRSAFSIGDRISITEKLHGCFTGQTKIRMGDGSLKVLSSVKVGDEVLGYNQKTGKIEPTKVLQVFHNSTSNIWQHLRFSRDYIRGDKRGFITCTPNHPFWIEEEQRFEFAENLKVGQQVSQLFPSIILTDLQKQIVIGQYLGDGCLMSFQERTCEIQGSSKKEHQAYQEWLSKITQGFYYLSNIEYTSGFGTTMIRGRTSRSADMYNFFKDVSTFDNKGAKKLLPGIIEKFTPISLAIFYMDDGSLAHNDSQQDRANFAICDYQDEDAEIICQVFRKFDIEPTLFKDNRGYNRIRLNTKEAYKMFDLIEQYIPDIMRYKLPEKYRSNPCLFPIDEEIHYNGYVLSPQWVEMNEQLNEQHYEYDIETALHNYIVGLSIVHNTSQRSMWTYAEIPNGFFRRLFRLKPKTRKEYVLGTRRTVMDPRHTKGYYGNEAFRLLHHDKLKHYIKDGMEVFYEVVGYINETTPIMPRGDNTKVNDKAFVKRYGKETVFSYGCEPGESKAYVYRINDNGREYTITEIQEFCSQIEGIEAVPLFTEFDFKGIEHLDHVVELYQKGESVLDPRHTREGVVIRIESAQLGFKAYKSKNLEFKILEGIIKSNADAPDIEEAQENERI